MKGEIAATTAMVLLLLALGAEAELCVWHSRTFRGWCHQNTNCAAICETEGYTGGFCQGLLHGDCMCSKDCSEGNKPPPAPAPATPAVPVLPPPAKPVAPPTPVVVAPPKPPVVVAPPVAVPAPVLPTPPPPAACKPPALEEKEVTVRGRRAGGGHA